ncbi:MAG: hypothetical protein ABSG51_16925 [Terracidiphilus sp.]|jgi:hypothetical protein
MNSTDANGTGNPLDPSDSGELGSLAQVFRDQLVACLEECAQGRKGLFSSHEQLGEAGQDAWPEAARLRELALALQAIFAQASESSPLPSPLVDEFLDLCSIHGESNPGERKLAKAFLTRIENGQVGTPTQEERKPW